MHNGLDNGNICKQIICINQFSTIMHMLQQSSGIQVIGEDEASINIHIADMQTEFLKLHPCWDTLRDRQKKTVVKQAADLQIISAMEILEKYP